LGCPSIYLKTKSQDSLFYSWVFKAVAITHKGMEKDMALGSHVQRVSMGSAMPGSKGYLSLQWDSHHGAHATIWA